MVFFLNAPPPESYNYENDEGSGGGQLKETPCIYVSRVDRLVSVVRMARVV